MRCIIPCAGYGTRLNMAPNESKELKVLYQGKPIIENSLQICKDNNLDPLIVTRKEKTDLIEYCEKNNLEYQVIEVEGEWPNTVLKSRPFWNEDNLLMLPDTIFEDSKKVIKEIKQGLYLGSNAMFALHPVNDFKNWGIVGHYSIIEKPQEYYGSLAWGLIGFKKEYGTNLFKVMKTRNVPFKLKNVGFTYLDFFKDVTRG